MIDILPQWPNEKDSLYLDHAMQWCLLFQKQQIKQAIVKLATITRYSYKIEVEVSFPDASSVPVGYFEKDSSVTISQHTRLEHIYNLIRDLDTFIETFSKKKKIEK
jgi:hypothetical protein